jgi:antitoxin component HigA of HigAB toxin-antitoxin module
MSSEVKQKQGGDQMPEKVPVYVRICDYVDNVAKLSHKALAINAGISEARLSYILSGKRKLTIDMYEVLCRAMSVDPAKFLTR